MTLKASVNNRLNSNQVGTYLFFDSGSQRSFISKNRTQKLDLISLTEKVLSIQTFESKTPITEATQLVEFNLLLQNRESMRI